MKNLARNLTVLAAVSMAGAQAYAQAAPVEVRDAPVHAVPSDKTDKADRADRAEKVDVADRAEASEKNGPVEDNAIPDTLNAQYATQSRPAPRPVRQVKAEPKPVEGPSAAIAARIIDSAGAFEAYMRKAGRIDAKFADGAAVSKAVATSSAYEIQQFQEGETAYAALAALQDGAFVQGVYDLGRDPRERAAFADRLLADPSVVLELDGADEAAAMVGGVLARMGADLVKSGQAVKQAAYDVQHQDWSKEDVPHADQRLADTKAKGAVKVSMGAADTDALIKTIVSLRKAAAESPGRTVAPSPVVERALAIAALAVLGRAGDEQIDMVAPLLSDAKSADCMKMAKLNLYQCMAAAGPQYEDVFCVGAHAMVDTGQCVVSAAGQSLIPTGAPRRVAVSAPVSRSVSVPMALASTLGPERQRAYVRASQAGAPEPAVAADDYVQEQDPRDAAPSYAPAPRAVARQAVRQAPREDLYAEQDRADERYYGDRYQAPARPTYRDQEPEAAPAYANRYANPYANPYGRPTAAYGYGR
jgi:hypothetical protein